MSAPGQQGGPQGGMGPDDSNPTRATTAQTGPTATGFVTSTTASHTGTSASSSGVQKGVVIGAVIGGIAGLLIISLLGVWLLQRRKQRQNGAKTRRARLVTYTSLNSVFRGIPFSRSSNQSPHSSLLPPPQVSQRTNTSLSGVALRGGEASLEPWDSANEMEHLPPSYTESQLSASIASLGLLNTTYHTHSDTIVSPLSSRDPNEAQTISPQTTGPPVMAGEFTDNSEQTHVISPQTTGVSIPSILLSQHTRDTMGFPIEQGFEEIRAHPETLIPIVAPVPRHPLMHQDSLERVVRQGLMPSQSPILNATNPNRFRVLSQEMPRESPVLGVMNQVRIIPQAAINNSLGRNNTQRTVSSISSMGIDMVSDGELERLGVGSRARYH
jgi:hypothetical protein